MDLMEYKAKELFAEFGIPTQKGVVIEGPQEVAAKTRDLKFPVVVKAQVQTGGRGKAGGIKFADDITGAEKVTDDILGMDIKGHIVKKVLIVEKADISQELYLSIMLDRNTKGPVLIFSPMGGVDIEETARTNPEKVIRVAIDPLLGVREYTVRYLLNRGGLEKDLHKELFALVTKLYELFTQYDCMLTEINPLALSDGALLALDGKVSIDDNALNRHPDMLEFRDSLDEDQLVVEARRNNFLYIPCDPEGDIAVMSNGSGMAMSCMDLLSQENLKVGVVFDLGGGATADRIEQAIRIVLSNKRINTLFISIFGGITRCDEVAGGLKLAMEKQKEEKAVVIRIEGTNKAKGIEILKSIKGHVIPVQSIKEGVRVLAARRENL